MLNAFTTYERFLNKYTVSYGVMCITLSKITLKIVNLDKHHLQAFPVLVKYLIEYSLNVWPVPVSNKMNKP